MTYVGTDYCEVGQHQTTGDIFRCAICKKSCCIQHMGNPNALPGDKIACPDHIAEVARQESRLAAIRQSLHTVDLRPFPTTVEELRAFIRTEVWRMLRDQR